MSLRDEVIEIVDKLGVLNPNQAADAILKAVVSIIPKPFGGIKYYGGRDATELIACNDMDNKKIGYNQALADIKARLEKG